MVEPTDELRVVFDKAVSDAQMLKHEYVTTEHFAFAMLCTNTLHTLLKKLNVDAEPIKTKLNNYIVEECQDLVLDKDKVRPKKTHTIERLLNRAYVQVSFMGKPFVELPDILISILNESQTFACYAFNEAGINKENFVDFWLGQFNFHDDDDDIEDLDDDIDDIDDEDSNTQTKPKFKKRQHKKSALKSYTVNLNEKAIEGKINPSIGREMEIEQIMLSLGRKNKCNALLVGFEGTGKTSIVEGLACQIVNGEVPNFLESSTIYSLDIGSMLAGSRYRGDFEERFKKLLEELNEQNNSILFIDEAHMVSGAGSGGRDSANDLANMLKPALSKGELKVIASTTWDEYRKYFEKDRALMRRLQRIVVDEPDRDTSIKILMETKKYYEKFHKADILDQAAESAVDLSIKYMKDKKLPDKAFDLIDLSCSRFKLKNTIKKRLTSPRIEYEVSKITGLPLSKITEKNSVSLSNLEKNLKNNIFGQNDAIETIVNKIFVSQAGLKDDNKPIGSFIFRGNTGTGKSFTATQLSEHLGVPLVRFDMSEYQEKHSVSKLIGSPPGYVGYEENTGLMITRIQENPGCVILLDEIEKAHPDVSQILLQMMDEGKVTASNGKEADVTNSIIILTTNLDAQETEKNTIGFNVPLEKEYDNVQFNQFFSPEFRNRLDAIITFNKLNKVTMKKIVKKMLNELQEKINKKNINMNVTDDAIEYLLEVGFDSKMGARPLLRTIDKHIKQPLSRKMLIGNLDKGGNLIIDFQNEKLVLLDDKPVLEKV
ncbi:MAG: AAA family ATPase [Candidatus Woesearchaeota archaeon]